MVLEKRFSAVILNACIITILMMVPVNAHALATKKIAFMIPDTSTKVMAEAKESFK